ncbi:MAG: aspartate carbamoyltransferase [Deltaproteobacteria bacterium RIFCSPHIGHO2_12_FULL_43_9]|nr:MAG: aspartate carbamoyltransferase [Deltaproteobacteria bacterium RIFCSPHIGHO2_12_FULL_43_9]
MMELTTRHLLDIADLSPQDISAIFDMAKRLRSISSNQKEITPSLKGKIAANLFFEPSTRTRVSFEMAAKRLGAEVVNILESASSVKKGETLLDTTLNLQAMGCNLFIIRHPESGVPHQIARHLKVPVINAGDGSHAHPSQALLDAMTLLDKWGTLEGKQVTIIGDIIHNRVAKSDLELFLRLGAKVTFCGPEPLVPTALRELGAIIERDFLNAIKNADAIMMLRMQSERWSGDDHWELIEPYRLTREHLGVLKKNALIMAPGPINRGVEIESVVADSERSIILDQVEWGLYVRMAILHLLGRGDPLRGSAAVDDK